MNVINAQINLQSFALLEIIKRHLKKSFKDSKIEAVCCNSSCNRK